MKKLIIGILVATSLLVCVSCGNSSDEKDAVTTTTTTTTTTTAPTSVVDLGVNEDFNQPVIVAKIVNTDDEEYIKLEIVKNTFENTPLKAGYTLYMPTKNLDIENGVCEKITLADIKVDGYVVMYNQSYGLYGTTKDYVIHPDGVTYLEEYPVNK